MPTFTLPFALPFMLTLSLMPPKQVVEPTISTTQPLILARKTSGGRRGGKSRGGGGLTGDSPVCRQTPQPLTALSPVDENGFMIPGGTISAQPTLWFYNPYTQAEVETIEFSVLSEDYTTMTQVKSTVSIQKPGLVGIRVHLPKESPSSQDQGTYYRWYLTVTCKGAAGKTEERNGWLYQLPSTRSRQQQIKDFSPEIWYDTVNALLAQRKPTNLALSSSQASWSQLLGVYGYGNLASEPIVGTIVVSILEGPDQQ